MNSAILFIEINHTRSIVSLEAQNLRSKGATAIQSNYLPDLIAKAEESGNFVLEETTFRPVS